VHSHEWSYKTMWAGAIGMAICGLGLIIGLGLTVLFLTNHTPDVGLSESLLRALALWDVAGSVVGLAAAALSFRWPLAGAGGMAAAAGLLFFGLLRTDLSKYTEARKLLIAFTAAAVAPLVVAVVLCLVEFFTRRRSGA
jgi:hypothetical protein